MLYSMASMRLGPYTREVAYARLLIPDSGPPGTHSRFGPIWRFTLCTVRHCDPFGYARRGVSDISATDNAHSSKIELHRAPSYSNPISAAHNVSAPPHTKLPVGYCCETSLLADLNH